MDSQVFLYNGSPITFSQGETTMVNATEMAKPFGNSKRAKNWLALNSTTEFIAVLSEGRNLPSSELVQVTYGDGGGTWMHEDVALEFARWLSPAFAIWCNDRIKELMRHGLTATPKAIDALLNNPDTFIRTLEALKAERERADAEKQRADIEAERARVTAKRLATAEDQRNVCHSENKRLLRLHDGYQREIARQAPKVEYFDNVLLSDKTYLTKEIAKELGLSAQFLNKLLGELGIQYRENGQWVLYTQYYDKGYTKTRPSSYTSRNGRVRTNYYLVWTEAGREFVLRTIKEFRANYNKKHPRLW